MERTAVDPRGTHRVLSLADDGWFTPSIDPSILSQDSADANPPYRIACLICQREHEQVARVLELVRNLTGCRWAAPLTGDTCCGAIESFTRRALAACRQCSAHSS